MRLSRGFMALGFLLPLVAHNAHAQSSFHVGGGATLPRGTFDDGFKIGWQAWWA